MNTGVEITNGQRGSFKPDRRRRYEPVKEGALRIILREVEGINVKGTEGRLNAPVFIPGLFSQRTFAREG
jgi:hypothetical protein